MQPLPDFFFISAVCLFDKQNHPEEVFISTTVTLLYFDSFVKCSYISQLLNV